MSSVRFEPTRGSRRLLASTVVPAEFVLTRSGIAVFGADGVAVLGADRPAIFGAEGSTIFGADSVAIFGADSVAIVGADGVAIVGADGLASFGASGIAAFEADGITTLGAGGISVFGAGGDFGAVSIAVFGADGAANTGRRFELSRLVAVDTQVHLTLAAGAAAMPRLPAVRPGGTTGIAPITDPALATFARGCADRSPRAAVGIAAGTAPEGACVASASASEDWADGVDRSALAAGTAASLDMGIGSPVVSEKR